MLYKLSDIDLRDRRNNLTVVRVLAATAVVFGHSFALCFGSTVPIWMGQVNSGIFGFLAVAVFFALSGFLITKSYFNSKTWWAYLEARLLRLLPGLFAANLFTALLLMTLITGFSSEWISIAVRYVRKTTTFTLETFGGVFDGNPEKAVNGSLWTLGYEFRFYLLVLGLGLLKGLSRKFFGWFVLLIFSAIAINVAIQPSWLAKILLAIETALQYPLATHGEAYLSLTICFLLGMVFAIWPQRLPLSPGAAVLFLVSSFFVDHWLVKVAAWVYMAFVFGLHPRLHLKGASRLWDVSYGIYILSYPIQQTVIRLTATRDPYFVFGASMLALLPVAILSWKFVEEPALRLKGRATSRFKRTQQARN